MEEDGVGAGREQWKRVFFLADLLLVSLWFPSCIYTVHVSVHCIPDYHIVHNEKASEFFQNTAIFAQVM